MVQVYDIAYGNIYRTVMSFATASTFLDAPEESMRSVWMRVGNYRQWTNSRQCRYYRSYVVETSQSCKLYRGDLCTPIRYSATTGLQLARYVQEKFLPSQIRWDVLRTCHLLHEQTFQVRTLLV
jgi:hypothetical protein